MWASTSGEAYSCHGLWGINSAGTSWSLDSSWSLWMWPESVLYVHSIFGPSSILHSLCVPLQRRGWRGLFVWVGTITGLDYWTGLLDWTTGLDYWTHPNCKIQLVQCRIEAKRTYSLSYFANTAPYWVQGLSFCFQRSKVTCIFNKLQWMCSARSK